MHGETVKKTG